MVLAPTTIAAVRAAGGWLFDSVMAGGDVVVLVSDNSDSRPLRILGARAGTCGTALSSWESGQQPHVLAADTELYENDGRIQRLVRRLLDTGRTEVRWCAQQEPAPLDEEAAVVRHRLSVAARAFKAQALIAGAARADSVDNTEVFYSANQLSRTAGGADLMPV